MLRVEFAARLTAVVAAGIACRNPGSAITMVAPDTAPAPVTIIYCSESPAKVIASPTTIVPVPAAARSMEVTPTA